MNPSYDNVVKSYRKHLLEVPPKITRERLKKFRLKDDVLAVEALSPCLKFTLEASKIPEHHKQYIHSLDPASIFDLKNWIGIENEIAAKQLNRRGQNLSICRKVELYKIPAKKGFYFEELDPEQKAAVHQLALNLLYGYVEEQQLERAPYAAVVNYMLERVKGIKIVVIPDLIVCPNEVATFKNLPILYFNNVIVYGNGVIRPGNNTKISAYQIKHVP